LDNIERFLEAHKKLSGKKFGDIKDSYRNKMIVYAYCLWCDSANLEVCANMINKNSLPEEFITDQLINTFCFKDDTIIGEA